MAYRIKNYTKQQAKKFGVEVRPTKVQGKKIDVYKDGKKIASVGALGYNDYPTFMEKEQMGMVPKGHANSRRKEYKRRHDKDRKVRGSRGWWVDKLLW